jgi:3-phenylpropionate/trans-cinnamate dioxygenase ferredoxin subunit
MDCWIDACATSDVESEEVFRFDRAGRTYAIYRTTADSYHATDGLCTHESVHLAGGYVEGNVVECPKHGGRFDFTTGKAVGAPVCVDLRTYVVKVEGGRVLLLLEAGQNETTRKQP